MSPPASASYSSGLDGSSARREAQLADNSSGDSTPATVAVATKSREVNSGSGERFAGPEGDKYDRPRPKWRRALVPGAVVLLVLALTFFIKIVGSQRGWWSL